MQRSELITVVVYLVVIALVVFRLMRPMRMRASRLWIGPAVIVLLSFFVIWASYEGHASALTIGVAVLIGVLLGVPFGLLRGRHTEVRKTDDPKVLLVQPSVIPLLIWFGAFAIRYVIRALLPHAGPEALAASDGFLAFALGSVIAARYVIAQKFKELHAV